MYKDVEPRSGDIIMPPLRGSNVYTSSFYRNASPTGLSAPLFNLSTYHKFKNIICLTN